jgi:GntR family transcriptional regulator
MPRALRVDPADARPIWSQIEEGVLHLVATGSLAAGAPVPSVRDLARELQVNPATVSKAYQRLTDAGVLSVRRGEGTFVSERPPAFSDGQRVRRLAGGAARYAALATGLGASRGEAVDTLRQEWNRLGGEREGAHDGDRD